MRFAWRVVSVVAGALVTLVMIGILTRQPKAWSRSNRHGSLQALLPAHGSQAAEWFGTASSARVDGASQGRASQDSARHLAGIEDVRHRSVVGFSVQRSLEEPLGRGVPDTRDAGCQDGPMLNTATALSARVATIVIIVHNAEPHTFFRALESILLRTPATMLKEIIIVDDASTVDYASVLKRQHPQIRYFRNRERRGLSRARSTAVHSLVHSDTVVFLDPYCEVNEGWLEPLLSHLDACHLCAASPLLDTIDTETMKYEETYLLRGGFGWDLQFQWLTLEGHRQSATKAYSSPVLAPVFAIDVAVLKRFGLFDHGMSFYGAEEIELSLRLWMCGGEVSFVPCSRVGMLFTDTSQYGLPEGLAASYTHNTLRIAEVWLDEYKQYHLQTLNEHFRSVDFGDVSAQLQLRDSLECEPFSWYLESVLPSLRVPQPLYTAWGELKSAQLSLCVDSMARGPGDAPEVGGCHGMGGNQNWRMTRYHEITTNLKICLEAVGDKVMLGTCPNLEEVPRKFHWEIARTGQLHSAVDGRCVGVKGSLMVLEACSPASPTWQFSFTRGKEGHTS